MDFHPIKSTWFTIKIKTSGCFKGHPTGEILRHAAFCSQRSGTVPPGERKKYQFPWRPKPPFQLGGSSASWESWKCSTLVEFRLITFESFPSSSFMPWQLKWWMSVNKATNWKCRILYVILTDWGLSLHFSTWKSSALTSALGAWTCPKCHPRVSCKPMSRRTWIRGIDTGCTVWHAETHYGFRKVPKNEGFYQKTLQDRPN